ncbi:MAG: ABC transporter substrate-binding protein [Coriobacteriales bacterium]|nr:ABC transporter substrate-binding protein [Coriobacteriales bacterium]
MRTTRKNNVLNLSLTFALILALLASLSLLPGCGNSTGTTSDQTTTNTSTATNESDASATNNTQSVDPMADRNITDVGGRKVTIPGTGALKSIYYTGATAEIFCFTLAPELAGGTTYEWTEPELELLPKQMSTLKYLGTQSGGKQLNLEAIMAEDIQLIFSCPVAAPTEKDISDCDDLQNQTGIPVVLLDGSLENVANTYRLLGEILGREADANKLALYCENKLAAVNSAISAIPENERIKLYYAEGPDGLQTEPETSSHAYTYKLAGANNVATVEAKQGMGMSNVSLEQVIAWDPEVIIAWSFNVRGGADELIRTDPNWSEIKAVRDGRVYTMPNVPFSWCDRPPAVNRFLGIQWIANLLYPKYYDVDMLETVKEFYALFYHVEISDAKAKELLGNSYTK